MLASLPETEIALFGRLLQLLIDGQQRMNLTAITDPAAIARQHFADSLAALNADLRVGTVTKAADIGTGAGFPLLPLAIRNPGCNWVGFESVAKKARFVEDTAAALGLTNVQCES